MARLLILASCLFALGCSRPGGDSGGEGGGAPAAADDTLAAYECAFRYQLQARPADVEAFLSVDGADPPAELLTRLRAEWPNLQPKSADPADKGLHIHVSGLIWNGRDKAVVRAGYWFPTKFAGQARFGAHHLARNGGRWAVTEVTGEVIGCG